MSKKIVSAQELRKLKRQYKARYSQIDVIAEDAALQLVEELGKLGNDYLSLTTDDLQRILSPFMDSILDELREGMGSPDDPLLAKLPRHNLGSFLATVKDGVKPSIPRKYRFYVNTMFNVLRTKLVSGQYNIDDLLELYEEDFLDTVITSVMNVWSSFSGLTRPEFGAAISTLNPTPMESLYKDFLKSIKKTVEKADPQLKEAIAKHR